MLIPSDCNGEKEKGNKRIKYISSSVYTPQLYFSHSQWGVRGGYFTAPIYH